MFTVLYLVPRIQVREESFGLKQQFITRCRMAEREEVHSQQASPFMIVFPFPSSLGWQHQGSPGFQIPGQQGHHHMRPVALQTVERCGEDTRFEFLNVVLLVAAAIRFEDEFVGRSLPVVCDIEETLGVIEKPELAADDLQVFPINDHSIGLLASGRRVCEFCHMLFDELNVFVLASLDDLLFDVFRSTATFGLDFVLRWASEPMSRVSRQIVRDFDEVGRGVRAKVEVHAITVPAVQVGGLGEVRIASQRNPLRTRLAAKVYGLIEALVGLFVAGPIAWAVKYIERLTGIGQYHHQRMIPPSAVVADVHALFTVAGGFDNGTVRIYHPPLTLIVCPVMYPFRASMTANGHLPEVQPCRRRVHTLDTRMSE